MLNVLNYGGGTQTVAICVLIAEGRLPKPGRIIMADTGREMPSTFDYLEQYSRPLMRACGLEIEIAPHTLAKVDVYSNNGSPLLPLYTETGKFPAFCSGEWKREVVRRFIRGDEARQSSPVTNWIGYAFDEKRRWHGKSMIDGPWHMRFPLVDGCVTTSQCKQIIANHGLPLPPKSRCWMCPNQGNEEWREVRSDPASWEAACQLDEELREEDDKHAIFLHHSRVPLREADLDAVDRAEKRPCQDGFCFI